MSVDDVSIVRFIGEQGEPVVGAQRAGQVYPLPVASHGDLLRMSVVDLRLVVEAAVLGRGIAARSVTFLPVIDGRTEVWAAGVTYLSSKNAREMESDDPSVYAKVYDNPRAELFFKAPAWRVVNHGGQIRVRADSPLNVPEPELALVLSAAGQILGYSICNDVSSRTIEGENPLYLPQAKVYDGSCSLAASWVPVWAVPDPYQLEIGISIVRDGAVVWTDTTTTGLLHRDLEELSRALFVELSMPDGAVLATGTCLAPAMDVTLLDGDVVTISIPGVGELGNTVVQPQHAEVRSSIRQPA
ncbi:fumarylacetoacetate hydrolase family protein [Streptomyces sioyaensis]|uniref:fumarylacetoacetate hydrolase family protein n=1 Tax=Streptomyces sioyaensis TaxID=67364 RepID=UPI003D75A7E8